MFPDGGVQFYGWPHQTSYCSRVLELTRRCRESVMIAQYVFGLSPSREWQRSNKVFKAMVNAKERGVSVYLLLDGPRLHAPNARTNILCARRFVDAGVEVRALAVPRTLHLKMLVFDREVMLAGSHNLTNSSLYSPFELTFECRDRVIVHAAGVYFQALWNGSMSEPYFDAVGRLRKGRS